MTSGFPNVKKLSVLRLLNEAKASKGVSFTDVQAYRKKIMEEIKKRRWYASREHFRTEKSYEQHQRNLKKKPRTLFDTLLPT